MFDEVEWIFEKGVNLIQDTLPCVKLELDAEIIIKILKLD